MAHDADRVKTALLILHNDKEGAVDWNQGIECDNTLRRLKKPVGAREKLSARVTPAV